MTMGIFERIKTQIFGKDGGPFGDNYFGHKKEAPAATPAPAPTQQHAPAPTAAPAPTPAAAPTPQPVDAQAAIARIAEQKGNPPLHWQTSIVDLMKLLDLDSSLDNRKELTTELGYTGAKDGSAEMNIWLHAAVMRELGKAGGQVPEKLKD
jgi:3-oxoacyl-ACP reductase-like protein